MLEHRDTQIFIQMWWVRSETVSSPPQSPCHYIIALDECISCRELLEYSGFCCELSQTLTQKTRDLIILHHPYNA